MENLQITAYLKTTCGWSKGVRAMFAKYNIAYSEKDIIQNPAFRWEMEQKTGQSLSPCVEVNGVMLSDVSGEEVETYLVQNGLLAKNEAPTSFPINTDCSGKPKHEQQEQHQHAV